MVRNFIIVLLSFLYFQGLSAQCVGSGTIDAGFANPAILDPDGDGDIVKGIPAEFSGCSGELAEFEELTNPAGCSSCQVAWTAIGIVDLHSDLSGGASCSKSDILSDGSSNSSFAYFTIFDPDGSCDNGDELIAFRLRLGGDFSGNFGYDFLVSNDGMVGTNDPDGIQCCNKTANPGFEYEVFLKSGTSGASVTVIDINGVIGTDNCGTAACPSYSLASNAQKAKACGSVCGCRNDPNPSDPVFLTFFVKLTDLGVSCSTYSQLTFVPVSGSSGNPVLSSCTSVSDIGGISENLETECSSCFGADYPGCNSDEEACAFTCSAELNSFSTVLPVEFISFNVNENNGKAKLNWSTALEKENSHFIVERSSNGLQFEEIQLVRGTGTTNTLQQYEHVDDRPLNGYNYYRIIQVDYNGRYSNSIIRSIKIRIKNLVDLYPTVVKDKLNLVIGGEKPASGKVIILDTKMSMVFSFSFSTQETFFNIDLTNYGTGQYYLNTVFDDGTTVVNPFFKI